MPVRSRRSLTRWRQATSITPVAIGRPAARYSSILHAFCVRREIAARCVHVGAFLFGQLLNRRHATQAANNTVHVAPQNPQQALSNEFLLGCSTPNHGLRSFPDVPRDMHDIKNIDHIVTAAVAQTRICIRPQTMLTVHQTNQQLILLSTLLDFSRSPRQRKDGTANNLVTQILNLRRKLRHQMLVLWHWSIGLEL